MIAGKAMEQLHTYIPSGEKLAVEHFWEDIAPGENIVHFYEDESSFLDMLEEFACGGLDAGGSVALIATAAHLSIISERLRSRNFNLTALRVYNRYFPLNVDEAISLFAPNGTIDEALFNGCLGSIIDSAGQKGRRVRVFSEIAAVLCARGRYNAAMRAEQLCDQWSTVGSVALYCAYPKEELLHGPAGFTDAICDIHTTVVEALHDLTMASWYRNV